MASVADELREPVVATITTPSPELGAAIARKLVEERLAACVQTVSPVRSFYIWDGELRSESETLLIVKTTRDRVAEIDRLLETEHPYEVPELVAVPVVAGGTAYLEWMASM